MNERLPSFSDFQPLGAIAVTQAGVQQLYPLCQGIEVPLWVPPSLQQDLGSDFPQLKAYAGSLRDHLASVWPHYRGFLFALSTGAVVRLISPLLEDKAHDPAIVVVDEAGLFAISLCGGHQGGADQITRLVALYSGATPVLTGSANAQQVPGIDILGLPFGWQRGTGDWLGVAAAKGESIQVIQESGTLLWQTALPRHHPFQFAPLDSAIADSNPSLKPQQPSLWISHRQHSCSSSQEAPIVQWHPRVLWVGVGCERGTSCALIETAILQVCQSQQLAPEAIAGIATLDLKADEAGLVELCQDRHWPLQTFTAEELQSIPVPTPSAVVAEAVGTPSVAEAAAIAISQGHLIVPKQIIRQPDQPGAVTVAIAQAEREYLGRTGKLWLVGTGPGDLSQITPAARTAIAQADAIIGYSLYINLVKPLLRPGQIIEALPITQERQRAQRAIDLAQWGLTVAVISSGDCGIYGMAGLTLEELQMQSWDGQTPEVQVFPGITALQAAASRVGAPLMHDFCAISLSDLLTPWQVIEERLKAAAAADFVVALYNPRSQSRLEPITIAQQIFLQYRNPQTPVALVRSAYREDEQIRLTTLEDFLTGPVDMLTTVLIGNRSTRLYANCMITPRGYLGFSKPCED